MKIFELEAALFDLYDKSLSAPYDNVGLLVGDKDDEIRGIVVSLDCTNFSISLAKEMGANLIVTHHPVIFEGMKTVLSDSLVFDLIKSGISVISLHTNLDTALGGVNDSLCEVIGLGNISCVDTCEDGFKIRMGEVDKEMTADEFALYLKEKLGSFVRYSSGNKKIKKVAVCSGSGSGFLFDAKKAEADAFVTAEVKHHIFYDAVRGGISIFDCGHFETENVVTDRLADKIKEISNCSVFACHQSEIKVI